MLQLLSLGTGGGPGLSFVQSSGRPPRYRTEGGVHATLRTGCRGITLPVSPYPLNFGGDEGFRTLRRQNLGGEMSPPKFWRCGLTGLLISVFLNLFRKILVSVKFSVRNSGAGNGCINFMDAWKNALCLQEKPMSIKFLVLGGGVFWVFFWGGECRFYFYGRADFSDLWFAKPMVCVRVAFHENDGNHGNDEDDEDDSDSYKQGLERWNRGDQGIHENDENHRNPGCKPRVPQTTGLEIPDNSWGCPNDP